MNQSPGADTDRAVLLDLLAEPLRAPGECTRLRSETNDA